VSKKGNEVFRLVAPSTEPVHHLVVDETHLYTAGEFSFQLYTNAKDAGFYTANDHILALAVLPSEEGPLSSNPRAPDAILACGDRKLHVVRKNNIVARGSAGHIFIPRLSPQPAHVYSSPFLSPNVTCALIYRCDRAREPIASI